MKRAGHRSVTFSGVRALRGCFPLRGGDLRGNLSCVVCSGFPLVLTASPACFFLLFVFFNQGSPFLCSAMPLHHLNLPCAQESHQNWGLVFLTVAKSGVAFGLGKAPSLNFPCKRLPLKKDRADGIVTAVCPLKKLNRVQT